MVEPNRRRERLRPPVVLDAVLAGAIPAAAQPLQWRSRDDTAVHPELHQPGPGYAGDGSTARLRLPRRADVPGLQGADASGWIPASSAGGAQSAPPGRSGRGGTAGSAPQLRGRSRLAAGLRSWTSRSPRRAPRTCPRPGLQVVAEPRPDARPDLWLVAGRGPDDLQDDVAGADRRDPEQPPLGAVGDEVADPGHASDRPEPELRPAGLGALDRRVRLPSRSGGPSSRPQIFPLPPLGLSEPA